MTARLKVLLGVLGILLLVAVPYTYLDRFLVAKQAKVEELTDTLAPQRVKVEGLRTLEQRLQVYMSQEEHLPERLVTGIPAVWSEVSQVARTAGVQLGSQDVQAGERIESLPGVVRYRASVQVAGSVPQFLAFLQGLEQSRYMIEIPDIALSPSGGATRGGNVSMTLQLGFFGPDGL